VSCRGTPGRNRLHRAGVSRRDVSRRERERLHHAVMRHPTGFATILAAATILTGCGPALPLPIGPQVLLVAHDIAWEPQSLRIQAGQQATVIVDNREPDVPHGFSIQGAGDDDLFAGQIVAGPARTTYVIPPLAPGGYLFLCPVHPMMQGKLAVG
jgi:plastocyanin